MVTEQRRLIELFASALGLVVILGGVQLFHHAETRSHQRQVQKAIAAWPVTSHTFFTKLSRPTGLRVTTSGSLLCGPAPDQRVCWSAVGSPSASYDIVIHAIEHAGANLQHQRGSLPNGCRNLGRIESCRATFELPGGLVFASLWPHKSKAGQADTTTIQIEALRTPLAYERG